MSETITITTKTIADRVGEFLSRLTNFNANQIGFELQQKRLLEPDVFDLMLVSESILAREWSTPEEDEAWANL